MQEELLKREAFKSLVMIIHLELRALAVMTSPSNAVIRKNFLCSLSFEGSKIRDAEKKKKKTNEKASCSIKVQRTISSFPANIYLKVLMTHVIRSLENQ